MRVQSITIVTLRVELMKILGDGPDWLQALLMNVGRHLALLMGHDG